MNRQLQLGLEETEGEKKERIKELRLMTELMLWIIGIVSSFVYMLVVLAPHLGDDKIPNSASVSVLIFFIIWMAFFVRTPMIRK